MQKTFFFAISVILLAAVVPAYATTAQHSYYDVTDNGDGTFTNTIYSDGHPTRILRQGNWVDYYVTQDAVKIQVETARGSISYDKINCSLDFYNSTSITGLSVPAVGNDRYLALMSVNGSGIWTGVNQVNNAACSVSIVQQGKNIEIQSLKHVAGVGDFKIRYIKNFNADWKTTLEPTNLSALTNRQFGLMQNMTVPKLIQLGNQTRDLSQYNGVVLDRAWLDSHKAQLLQFRNGINFDFSLGYSNLKTITIYYTGGNTGILSFSYTRNAPILLPGQTLSIDPTYGYTSSGVTNPFYYFDGTTGSNCQNSVSGTATKDTSENFRASMTATGATNGCILTIPKWDISSIPASSIADSATLRYDVASAVVNMGTQTCAVFQVTHDPSTNTPTTMYYDGANINNGTTYARGDTTCRTTAADKTISLSVNATNYLTSTSIPLGWFALSMLQEQARDGVAHVAETLSGAGTMDLQIVYHADTSPPKAITTLAASGTTTTTTNLSWTAPGMGGGSLQRYVINYTSPCGTPTTHLANGTTATSYAVTGLNVGTCYSFRASAATQYGYNTTGANIVNVTTLAFNPGNYTIGFFDYNVNNPVMLPIRYERIDNGSTTLVNVTFTKTFNMACDLRYTYAGTNHTYHTISSIPVSSSENEASFRFTNSSNDITTFHCWNQAGNQSANYVLTQTDFLLKQQVRDFRNGTYGTSGQLGAFDFITLVVVIISMIGLNRNTEAVGGFFAIVAVSVLAYFEIIQWYVALISALAVVILLAISSTRKT